MTAELRKQAANAFRFLRRSLALSLQNQQLVIENIAFIYQRTPR